jgi:hypothetical protein
MEVVISSHLGPLKSCKALCRVPDLIYEKKKNKHYQQACSPMVYAVF